jgi:hypothetical protein
MGKKNELSSDDIVGIAVGQMGLALEDFLRLTPFEFSATYKHWLKHNEHQERMEWERARWSVFKAMTPPNKKQITMLDLIEFPWEKEIVKKTQSSKERFEQLKKKWQ